MEAVAIVDAIVGMAAVGSTIVTIEFVCGTHPPRWTDTVAAIATIGSIGWFVYRWMTEMGGWT